MFRRTVTHTLIVMKLSLFWEKEEMCMHVSDWELLTTVARQTARATI
jgi:hypothetical protein